MTAKFRDTFSRDLLASFVVFLVALPLCMGIAIASGVPPAKGLLTGIIGGIVVGALAGSPLQVSGPAAGLAVIVFELVREQGIGMLGPILMLAGLIQFAAGSLKLGQWFRAMSPAVIYGMLTGIGILIAAAQFHVMLDDKPRPGGLANLLAIPSAVFSGVFPIDGSKHEVAALLGIATIGVLVLWQKFRPASLRFLPGALLGVAFATTLASVLDLSVQRVDVPSNLLEAIQLPTLGGLQSLGNFSILVTAAAVAFIASAETLLSAAAVDQMQTGPRTNYDRELAAQGIGNMLCGLVGSLPMTGVIVRSSANVQAGAVTRLSAVLHGVWILAFVSLMPGLLQTVPTCSLAAVLVYTGYKLIHVEHVKKLLNYGKLPVLIFAATVITIVAKDLLSGVLVGLGLSLIKILYKLTHLRVQSRHDLPRNRVYLSLDGAATFLGIPKLGKILDALPAGTELHVDIERVTYMDHACHELFSNWARQNVKVGGRLVMEWESARFAKDSLASVSPI